MALISPFFVSIVSGIATQRERSFGAVACFASLLMPGE